MDCDYFAIEGYVTVLPWFGIPGVSPPYCFTPSSPHARIIAAPHDALVVMPDDMSMIPYNGGNLDVVL